MKCPIAKCGNALKIALGSHLHEVELSRLFLIAVRLSMVFNSFAPQWQHGFHSSVG